MIFKNYPLRVWVCPVQYLDANGSPVSDIDAAETWGITLASAGAWVLLPGLIPISSTETASSIGSAEFQLLRSIRTEVGDNQPYSYPGIALGMYVAIDTTTDGTGPLSLTDALWTGYITHIDKVNISGDDADAVGTVHAREIGDLLDRQQMRGWQRYMGGPGQPLRTPPSANIGDASGQIIGNCIQYQSAWLFTSTPDDFGYAYPDPSGSGVYTGDTSKYWTRWRLLQHAIYCCRTSAMPSISIVCQDGSSGIDPTDDTTIAGFLNQTTLPEVFSTLDVLTWRGFLDLMIPRDRNLGWTIGPDDQSNGSTTWTLFIYSSADDSSYGMPANTNQVAIDATADPLTSVREVQDASDLPDKIVIEGSNCVFNATLAVADSNLARGWNSSVQSSYFSGASGLTGYSGLASQFQQEQNRLFRNQGWLKDVFARFVINPGGDGDVRIALQPGIGNGQANALCPLLAWDTDAKTLSLTDSSATPYLGASVVLRTLSVPYGYKSDGTDQRTQWQKVQPQYMPMRAFLYDSTLVSGWQWKDLSIPSPLTGNVRASISPDDRGASVRVEFCPRELFSKGVWPTDGSAAIADVIPSVVGLNPDTLVVTLAIESDQKVRVEMNRPGLGTSDQYVNRPLIIRLPQLQCMGIHKGTIIGLAGPNGVDTPDMWTATHTNWKGGSGGIFWLRNDWSLADRYLSQAANFAFRPRRSIAVESLAATATPSFAAIGALITGVIESETLTNPVSTVVENVTRIYGKNPRLAIQTSLPHAPAFMGKASGARLTGASRVQPSPSSGGPISNSLGATPAQAIHHLRHRVEQLHQQTRQTPLVTALPYQPQTYTVQIVGGQLISGTVPVIQYAADPLTIPSAYNAQTATSTVAGIGIGYLYSPAGLNVGKVLVRHNFAAVTDPVMAGNVYNVGSPVSVPVSGGGAVQAYPILSVGG